MIKYHALSTLKTIPMSIKSNGKISKIKAEMNFFIVEEIFNSIIHHIFKGNLLPLLKMCYLSLSISIIINYQ